MKITLSTYEFLKKFPDEKSARTYVEQRRWKNGVICPCCGSIERIQTRKVEGYFRCLSCTSDFTVRTGTIFERSHVALDKWLYTMYLMAISRKGISSLQLSKEIGVTQKTAWFMLQRLRESCGNDKDLGLLAGIVEADETCKEFSKNQPTLVSLFAGAGGMDIGFEKAGFRTVWANEYDKTISPSYQKYFPKTKFDGRSIRDIPDDDLPETVTGVIGGPPCQSWSEAGARRGIEDPRGELFFEYLRVIKRTKPTFFVAENVHGLIHARNIGFFNQIIKLFESEGYVVSWKLLKASDYGVPQDRERVFIVGYHQSLNKTFKFPEPLKTKTTLRDAIGDLAKLKIGATKKVKNHEFMDSGYSPIFMSRNRVRSWDEQSYTILATDRHIPFHPQAPKMVKVEGQALREFAQCHESKYRRLTIRECARIQTFPDDYEFVYTNMRNAYKMIGNAVPVDLAYWVAKTIKDDLGLK